MRETCAVPSCQSNYRFADQQDTILEKANHVSRSSRVMIGRSILHYDIVEVLGRGGMGVVYGAKDTHLDRSVAIKVLPAEKVADPDRKRRFVQEARIASALNHPNIVHIYD